ncbi:MAG: cytochrome C, partial [Thiobacillus sp.]|nr:cytochrome C [Thiobacillus sp.]
MCRAAPILMLLIALAGHGLALANPADDASLPGQRIYRDGILPSGEPVRAMVQKGVGLSGADAACAKCHRRSGLGGSEGSSNIRPIAGRLLFIQPETARPVEAGGGASAGARVAERPAYTEARLARALRDGIDPAGHALNPLMPRYTLSGAEVAQLHTYLGALSSEPAAGVSDTTIHFATIIAPGVSPDKTGAMLDVLQAFVSDKNGGTRKETRRREVGREQMYRAFRTWKLHPWELTGPPQTWGDQLAAYYRQQPVFAVIGGIGSGSWQPVHTFCETFELPCIFPDVDYPDVTGTGYYPLYFSRGVTLEAEVLAKHLLETRPSARNDTVVQVYRDNALGRVPAQVLRKALLRSR